MRHPGRSKLHKSLPLPHPKKSTVADTCPLPCLTFMNWADSLLFDLVKIKYISGQQNPGKLIWSGSGGNNCKSNLQQIMVSFNGRWPWLERKTYLTFSSGHIWQPPASKIIRGNERPSASTRRVVAYLCYRICCSWISSVAFVQGTLLDTKTKDMMAHETNTQMVLGQ